MNYKKRFFKHHKLNECDVLYCVIDGSVAVNLHHIKGRSDHPDNLCPLSYKHHTGHHNSNTPTTEQIIIARNKNLYNPELTFNIIEV